ncbi:MAG: hypothetical protein WCW14_00910 [Candidatus Paceibacterota bacterium]|jgi:hypothetical protein
MNKLGKLADRSYFDQVIHAMRMRGFVEFAEVTTTAKDAKYHVPATECRNTAMFFHLPQRTLIIQLDYNESDSYDQYDFIKEEEKIGVTGCWSIEFHMEFLPFKMISQRIVKANIPSEEWDSEINKIPFFHRSPESIAGFPHSSGKICYSQRNSTCDKVDPEAIADGIGDVIDQIADILEGGQFSELQVTGFPPYYTFPGCEVGFWNKFNRSELRRLVRRAWGSDGLKR